MIFLPPQHGKSEISSRRFPAYKLGLNPKCKIALCSYGAEHAQGFNRDIQRIVDDTQYREVFPNTFLNSKNVSTDSSGSWKRTSNIFETVGYGGFVKTVGVGGALTGTTVDVGIIDDPFKDREEANSQRIRDRVWNWYTDVFESRLHNDSQQLLLFTRWHEDDLGGRLLKRDDDWVVITMRALKEEGDDSLNKGFIEDKRQVGEALWEQRHSREKLEKIRDNSTITFASLYQQRPAPLEGGFLKKHFFEVVDVSRLPAQYWSQQKYFIADLAYTAKEENDPTGVMCFRVFQNQIWIEDYMSYRERFEMSKEKIVQFMNRHNSVDSPIWIENKAGGLDMSDSLKINYGINAIDYKLPSKSKIERLMNIIDEIYAGRIKIVKKNWEYDRFISQLLVFPNGKHDEEVDCLTIAGALVFKGATDTSRRIAIY